MDNEIELKKIIARYARIDYNLIDLNAEIKNHYIGVELKDNFANNICQKWPAVNCTAMHNDMFVILKTGRSIIDRIESGN